MLIYVNYYFMVLVAHIQYPKDMSRPTTEDMYLQAFGKHLAMLREERGISQEKLSAQAGISRETISHIENGRQWARLSMLHRLAKALSVPTEALFTGLEQ
jgi:DNA-binding XRE family transcriptional regulator